MPHLVTTLGPKTLEDLGPGPILPHEHLFVDLRTEDQPGYAQADPAAVLRLMLPEIARARAFGVTAIVEPSTVGVGRRPDLLLALSQASGFPLVAPTGAYREPWLPARLRAAPEAALRDWMIAELTAGIDPGHPLLAPSPAAVTDPSAASVADAGPSVATVATVAAVGTPAAAPGAAHPSDAVGPAGATRASVGASAVDPTRPTDVRAGWIKLGATDEGLTDAEAKLLRAAARASRATGAAVGSHTLRGPVARAQLDIFERAGADPARFVWIHAHREPDVAIHHALARRGAFLSYDTVGDPDTDDLFLALVGRALDADHADRLLLSHDRGWYDPAHPIGGTPRPYTYLFETFLPKLAVSGLDPATLARLTRDNPFAAFAR